MIRNVGVIDGVIRTLISVVLIYIGFIDNTVIIDSLSRNIITVIGVLSLVVVIVGVCPLYSLTGISTCSQKDKLTGI